MTEKICPALKAATCAAALCYAGLSTLATAQPAQPYPSRPIRLIIGQTTGTSVDTLVRVLSAKLGDRLGQQVVADNRPGAGGIIGAEIAARAVPDGYTLFATSTGVQVISPQIYRKLPYDPIRDFTPISMFAVTQNVLVVGPTLGIASVKDLIAYAKANPGKLNMANAGAGFQSHLAGVLFTHMTGTDMQHVPYKGGASLIAVMSNESQLTIAPGPSLMVHVRSGRLRALATGGERRSPLTPELPTIIESGVPGFVSTGWAGLMGPQALPRPIFEKIYGTLIAVMKDPATRELLERQGGEPVTSTPAEMVKFIGEESARFAQAVKLAKLKVE